MRNKIRENIYLLIIFITIAIFTSYSLDILEETSEVIMNAHDFLSKNSIYCSVKGAKDDVDLSILKELGDNYLLMIQEGYSSSYYIYFNTELEKEPQMLKGRFFNEEDFINNNSKYAVIGKNKIKDIIKLDNKEFYYFNDDYYEVIGIIGDENKATSSDSSVYIGLNDYIFNKGFSLQSNYYLDGKGSSEEVYNQFKKIMSENSMQVTRKDNKVSESSVSLLNQEKSSTVKYVLEVVSIFVLSVILVIEYWVRHKKKEISIKRALGATKLRIYFEIIFQLVSIAIISFIIGNSLFLVVSYITDGYLHFHIKSTLYVLIIVILSSITSAFIPIMKVNKISIKEAMR